ncbi:hypothetical protein DAEQUDRAFT_34831 [Daedalea quercina L-15889]|uniref:Uncharacterized protein n=1 Tax=Daedalea quercina L-15889 TaxID=1314783 RepID=A0A165SSA7_9APHY|nr:hypothetical protein DAEQUDRAFT_34831 [Daedalea quercina L-15889]
MLEAPGTGPSRFLSYHVLPSGRRTTSFGDDNLPHTRIYSNTSIAAPSPGVLPLMAVHDDHGALLHAHFAIILVSSISSVASCIAPSCLRSHIPLPLHTILSPFRILRLHQRHSVSSPLLRARQHPPRPRYLYEHASRVLQLYIRPLPIRCHTTCTYHSLPYAGARWL